MCNQVLFILHYAFILPLFCIALQQSTQNHFILGEDKQFFAILSSEYTYFCLDEILLND